MAAVAIKPWNISVEKFYGSVWMSHFGCLHLLSAACLLYGKLTIAADFWHIKFSRVFTRFFLSFHDDDDSQFNASFSVNYLSGQ